MSVVEVGIQSVVETVVKRLKGWSMAIQKSSLTGWRYYAHEELVFFQENEPIKRFSFSHNWCGS